MRINYVKDGYPISGELDNSFDIVCDESNINIFDFRCNFVIPYDANGGIYFNIESDKPLQIITYSDNNKPHMTTSLLGKKDYHLFTFKKLTEYNLAVISCRNYTDINHVSISEYCKIGLKNEDNLLNKCSDLKHKVEAQRILIEKQRRLINKLRKNIRPTYRNVQKPAEWKSEPLNPISVDEILNEFRFEDL